jgi:lipopolysaccharide/colanic/teichoic acid biosynthesis glycosyltransferase
MDPQVLYRDIPDIAEYKKSFTYEFMKRFIDIVGAALGLIILFPILFIVSIAIKLDSPGPLIFSQTRCGKNGKKFKMYKFRSMVVNAEGRLQSLKAYNEMSGPVFKIKNDPRITKVGKFVRNTSIDELPQLINILKGEMSIVGPRPPIESEVAQYNTYQMQRLIIKPGLTCYWQIMGRNSIDFDHWVELDIRYIRERNLLLDIKLILITFSVLFGDNNAY